MKTRALALLLVAALARPAVSQPGTPGDDPLARFFFPPELVLQYASDIKLQVEQRKLIVDAVKEMQGDLFDLKMQMAEHTAELMRALGGTRYGNVVQIRKLEPTQKLDEAKVLAQVDLVLAVEREMKRRQMQLLIRIRNALTPEQQARLNSYRDHGPPPNRPEGVRF